MNLINLKGIEIDLEKIGIDFKLNDQQEEALNKICDFLINKSEKSFTLMGYAGTGKSSLIKILLKWIDQKFFFYDYAITAPTHRAKVIIEELSGEESKTLHSILNLRPDISIEKLDHRNIVFDNKTKKTPSMPRDLLIIDEGSMIQDALLKLIEDKTGLNNTQVLYIGDSAQLKPVKQLHLSKIFEIVNRYELTKVERQKNGNPIGPILDFIRTADSHHEIKINHETNLNEKNQGIEFFNNSSELFEQCLSDFQDIVNGKNYLQSRILCFKNDRVQLYNKLIRKRLGFTKEIEKNDLIMGYSNVGDSFLNSCDYIIDCEPKLLVHTLEGDIKVKGYDVSLVSTNRKNFLSTLILSTENSQTDIDNVAEALEDLRILAFYTSKDRLQKLKYIKQYYALKDSFISSFDLIHDGRVVKPKSYDSGFSHTVHRAQGGTYKNVVVDFKDIESCYDIQLKNQLKYVALSRVKDKATVFY
jgi:ATP-dependent exoDNAse (exonuclease V) alpha subunit